MEVANPRASSRRVRSRRATSSETLSRRGVAPNLAERDGAGPVAVRLLHAAGGGRGLARRLVASCLRGALPPVDLRAVCFVRAMVPRGVRDCSEVAEGASTDSWH